MQINYGIKLLALKRALGFGVKLYCLLFCVAAWGANEIFGTYDYKGFDANGTLLVKGVITLHMDETHRVIGEWKLRVIDRNRLKELGLQDGYGKIGGQLKGDTVFLSLNPEEFGDNIYLGGKFTKAGFFKIKGKYGHYGYYQGKIIEGNFEMVRK